MEKIKALWYRLPLWLRQTIVEALEAAVAVGATYTLSFISGEHNFDVQALTAVMIKAILKSLRANPNIPIKDYVNDQKNG